jgi:enoyl-CoA hydratase/carnithine racemase
VSEHVKTELTDGVLVVTLQRPDKKNALTGAMYNAMSDALDRSETDPAVKVVVFQGDGDSFTAGNDLADFAAQSKSNSDEESPAFRFIKTIGIASKPLIAAVQGNAVGIGTTMLLHCDLVYLAEGARLITPFVNLALVPEAASSWLLPARVGHVRAYQMFALGEPMDAATAVASGLASAVLPVAEVRARAMAAAITLTKRPAGALSATKLLMRDIERIQSIISLESDLFKERLKTPEAREAFAAFAERRPPDFSKPPVA